MAQEHDSDESGDLHKYLANQEKELAIKGQELSVRQIELQNNVEYAKAELEAYALDRRDERGLQDRFHKRNTVSGSIVLAFLMAAILALIFFDKEAILSQLIQITVAGFGGYHWGRHKQRAEGD